VLSEPVPDIVEDYFEAGPEYPEELITKEEPQNQEEPPKEEEGAETKNEEEIQPSD
jgi:hypothetical protein